LYKCFFHYAAQNSAVLNFALGAGASGAFNPIADAAPYANLLSAKFVRATSEAKPQIPFSDLSFGIFDELISPDKLQSLTFVEVVKYRRESADAREAFLEMLSAFHSKAGEIPEDGNYGDSIQRIIVSEVRPAARKFRDRLETIHESMFGKVKESTLQWVGGAGLAHLLAGLSWEHFLMLGTAGAAASAVVQYSQGRREEKAARRECAISYVLDLESQT
jgi:hypothetical protein